MEIEIINRNHPDIKKKPLPRYEQFVSFILNEEKRTGKLRGKIYFSIGAVRNNNIESGSYAQFINEDSRIILWFSEDKDGFELKKESTKGLWIYNNSLVKKLIGNRDIENRDRFIIRRFFHNSAEKYIKAAKTSILFEILISESITRKNEKKLNG